MTNANRIKLHERRSRALTLRIGGATFREIADQLGLSSPGNAHRDVRSAMAEIIPLPAREALMVELARLDAIVAAIWPAVTAGDLKACKVMLQCLARRAAYLGLDQPSRTRVELAEDELATHRPDTEESYELALAALNEILGPPPGNEPSNDLDGQPAGDAQAHRAAAAKTAKASRRKPR